MATRVKMLMLTLKSWTVGQNWHMNSGRSHRWRRAAWNCERMTTSKIWGHCLREHVAEYTFDGNFDVD